MARLAAGSLSGMDVKEEMALEAVAMRPIDYVGAVQRAKLQRADRLSAEIIEAEILANLDQYREAAWA
jgi:hypothetical protein